MIYLNALKIKFKVIRMNSTEKGFTLIELIIVIAILAILGTIAVPKFVSCTKQVKASVCNMNCRKLEKLYDTHLTIKNVDHTDQIFQKYIEESLGEICPENGIIDYKNSQVKCNIHSEYNEDDSDEEIPYL